MKVRDYGRGIPLGKLVDCVSIINTGAKYDSETFQKAVGLNGVGQKAVNALSLNYRAQAIREGETKVVEFEKGKLKSQSRVTKTDERNGTLIEFTPDEALFGKDFKFRTEFIEDMLWNYAFLNRGLTLTLNGKPFKSENGLKDLLTKELSGEPLYPIIHLEGEDIEIALTHGNHYGEEYWSFVNGQHTTMGGTHLAAFREAFVETVRNHFKKDYDAADVRQSIDAAIVVRVQEPVFESQTKTKLGSTEHRPEGSDDQGIRRQVRAAVARHLPAQEPRDRRDHPARRSRRTSTSARNSPASATSPRERAKKASLHNRKLRDCRLHLGDKNPRAEESTLFIVEGDSAAGSLTATRDVQTQAVFALKGKPLNTYGLTKKVIYENEEFHLLQSALNIEDGLDGLRYNKIVIATDADVDGMHIRLLLLSFFLQFFPDVIRNNHLFILQTPLFRVRNKKETIYCYTEQEKQAAVAALGASHEITRFKGLGEISAGEFKDFIGENIRLDPINLHHLYSSRRTPLLLHGQEHARAAGLHHRESAGGEGPGRGVALDHARCLKAQEALERSNDASPKRSSLRSRSRRTLHMRQPRPCAEPARKPAPRHADDAAPSPRSTATRSAHAQDRARRSRTSRRRSPSAIATGSSITPATSFSTAPSRTSTTA